MQRISSTLPKTNQQANLIFFFYIHSIACPLPAQEIQVLALVARPRATSRPLDLSAPYHPTPSQQSAPHLCANLDLKVWRSQY